MVRYVISKASLLKHSSVTAVTATPITLHIGVIPIKILSQKHLGSLQNKKRPSPKPEPTLVPGVLLLLFTH